MSSLQPMERDCSACPAVATAQPRTDPVTAHRAGVPVDMPGPEAETPTSPGFTEESLVLKNQRSLALLLVAVSLGLVAHARPARADIIPDDRATVWNPGIPGGVPARTTVCATVSASTYGNGSQNATSGIQSAIDACPVGQVVQLSAGTFRISSGPIRLNKGVVLRGAGPTQTLLQAPSGTSQAVVVLGQQWPSSGSSTNLTTNAVKGANSVTVASVSGLVVGETRPHRRADRHFHHGVE